MKMMNMFKGLKHILIVLSYAVIGLFVIYMMIPSGLKTSFKLFTGFAGSFEIYAGDILESDAIDRTSAVVADDIVTMTRERDRLERVAKGIPESSVTKPTVGDLIGEVSIESVGIRNDLYFGDTLTILQRGAGMYAGSALPGYEGLKLVCAHNQRGQFGELEKTAIGDIVKIRMPYAEYEYKVMESKVVLANDSSTYDFTTKKDQMIVYTCYPMYYTSLTDYRLFLYCERVSGPSVIR